MSTSLGSTSACDAPGRAAPAPPARVPTGLDRPRGGVDFDAARGRLAQQWHRSQSISARWDRLHAAEWSSCRRRCHRLHSHRGSGIDFRIRRHVCYRRRRGVRFAPEPGATCPRAHRRRGRRTATGRPARPVPPARQPARHRALAPRGGLPAARLGALMAGANALIGMHDQFVPDGAVPFHDHVGSKGKSESPCSRPRLVQAAGPGRVAGDRAQLCCHMRLSLRPGTPAAPRKRAALQDILRGSARVPLDDFRVRVVAMERERPVPRARHSKNRQTTRSFRTCRAVVLYDRRIDFLPAGAPVERYVAGESWTSERLYSALLPPLLAGPSHGINLRWEAAAASDSDRPGTGRAGRRPRCRGLPALTPTPPLPRWRTAVARGACAPLHDAR